MKNGSVQATYCAAPNAWHSEMAALLKIGKVLEKAELSR